MQGSCTKVGLQRPDAMVKVTILMLNVSPNINAMYPNAATVCQVEDTMIRSKWPF